MTAVRFPGAVGSFTSVHTDSREVQPGGLFFALRGAETDGHRFVADAVARGAAGIVVERSPEPELAAEVVVVPDTWQALYELARSRLEQAAPIVIGITGSNGKTSTKEMLAAILATRYRVLSTEGNLNTETGVPLTILRLQPGVHEVLVLEMGMQGPGQIARLAALASPRIGIVTGIGTVHIEFFDSVEGIARAKAELVEALPADGLAILNADDPTTPLIRARSRAPILTFGLEGGDFHGDGYSAGAFTVRGVPVRLRIPGRHQARNALAALAAAEHLGVPIEAGAAALADVEVDRRLQSLPAPAGFSVVDDAYNASPESMLAAFDAVSERPHPGRLLAVLGEMRELGPLAREAHQRVGARAREVFDELCVVDVGNGRLLAEAAGAELVPDKPAAVRWVRARAGEGDVVLVKASHGVALEDVVEELLRS
ncbi:MAG: UDP-N-acetylmuramoyl-tripeptide--D-alanyl-D-alanine ligase [Candidatus Dormibacteraeota bacterium]|nr:UDP-N-acetylmuramoyl-tripeptide--D-alanyl-D-alanine ligase [Candidatus Dormibacteraeota bacterium]